MVGGVGFIGSHLVDLLIDSGHEVIVLDDLSTGSPDNINPKATFIKGNATNKRVVHEAMEDVGYVFHLAALPRIPRSIDEPKETHMANVVATIVLLNEAKKRNIERFIYSSSSSVYGKQRKHKMKESMIPNPLSPYALQKWQSEQYCMMYHQLFGVPTIRLRYFNVYGPRQVEEGAYSLVIGKFMRQKRDGKMMTIFGDGTQTRAYTHVLDVARANYLAMTKGTIGDVYNIGTTKETSVNEIAKLLMGGAEYIVPNPRAEFEEQRKCANIQKAKKELGWTPNISIHEGIQWLNEK